MLEIRPPDANDLAQLLALGRRFHEESWMHVPYDADRAAAFFASFLTNENSLCRVADDHGRIRGALAARRRRYWFSNSSGIFAEFLYVEPEFRGAGLDYRLWRGLLEQHGSGAAVASTPAGEK